MFDKKAEVETAIRNGQGWIRVMHADNFLSVDSQAVSG
jgi:hypothetical protein